MSNVVVLANRGERGGRERMPMKKDARDIVCGIPGFYFIEAYDGRTLIVGYWTSEQNGRTRHSLTPFSYRRNGETLYSRKKAVAAGKKPLYLSHRRISGKGYINVSDHEEKRYSDDEIDLILEMEQLIHGAIAQGIVRAYHLGQSAA